MTRTRQRAWRPAPTVAVAVVVGLLAGCGDEEGRPKAEFVKEVNAICKRHNDRISAAASKILAGGTLPDPREFGRLARETILPEYAAQIRELRAVEPSPDEADAYKAWLEDSQALRAMLESNPALIQQPRAVATVNAGANRLKLSEECRIGPG